MLTTPKKAENAYKTIVGVERRDPSLVYWQEGSSVIVRVFPVETSESRIFKLGITSPLQNTNKRLVYRPSFVEGMEFEKTGEHLTIRFMQEPQHLVSSLSLEKKGNEKYEWQGKYPNDWSLTMDEVEIPEEAFHFRGKRYVIHESLQEKLHRNITSAYLDINSSWNQKEFNDVYEILKDKKIQVYSEGEFITLGSGNKDRIFNRMQYLRFSFFPVWKTNFPDALIISKSNNLSPILSDLKGSLFMEELEQDTTVRPPVLVYDIGTGLSPYLKTLKEYRMLQYCRGDIQTLKKQLNENEFNMPGSESGSCIFIQEASISIRETEEVYPEKAPDHLMRLYAYNHIMKSYAPTWNQSGSVNEKILSEARDAHVVSPISSLIVLESAKDYVRFDIATSNPGLGNASGTDKKGIPISDPEWWGWFLILLSFACYLRIKQKNAVQEQTNSQPKII